MASQWRCLIPFILITLVALPLAERQSTLAFGPTGHRVIGRIAERHLSPRARKGVRLLLARETLAEVATWPDDIRSDPKWRHADPWHFVTIEDGETYAASDKNSAGDAVEAIDRFRNVLTDADATQADKATALKWLTHLVGDLHQPLHVGRRDDRGGNTIRVKWHGEDTNLHSVWDSRMIDTTRLSFSELAQFIDNKITPQDLKKWRKSTVLDWVNESIELREQVYTRPDPSIRGSYEYSYKNLPLVKQRLAQAGVRLAGLLNATFTEGGPAEESEDAAEPR